jgi:FHS family glucose/mannose:H+ symporter-like MFS transporter
VTLARAPHPAPWPAPARLAAPAIAGAFLTMLVLGLLVSSLGPLLPALRVAFGAGPAAAGVLVASVPTGGLFGVLLSAAVARRYDTRTLLAGASAALALGQLGTALAPAWPLLLASGVLTGIGYGGVTTFVNGMIAAVYGARSTVLLNLANGVFGIGAVLGPLCVALVPSRAVYAGYAALAALAPVLYRSLAPGTPNSPSHLAAPGGRAHGGRLALFALVFACYVAVEVSTGGWITSHLRAVEMDAETAVFATSLFFAGLAAGRIAVAPVGLVVGPGPMLLGCAVGMCAGLLLAWAAPLGGIAYLLTGVAMGPIFPTGLAWVALDQAAARHALPIMLVAGNIGGLLLPPLVGVLVGAVGAEAAPLPLAASAAVGALAVGALLVHGHLRSRVCASPSAS